jgi:hypothetical protein
MRQIEAAPDGDSLRVSFTLTTPAGQPYRDAASTRETVQRLVEDAGKASKSAPERLDVRDHIQSFSLQAKPAFLRELVQSGEIAKAMPERSAKEMANPPVGPPKRVDVLGRPPVTRKIAKKR